MSSSKNKHGLSRYIPEEIKREVRQACGFGCVICGSSIIEYEHIDPPFSEAREHNPSNIALLCPQCHARVTRNFWSKDKVRQARLNPQCMQAGYSSDFFDFGASRPSVLLGGMRLQNLEIPLMFKDKPAIEIKEPEQPGAPFRLSANFFNASGEQTLWIDENEWSASTDNWDVVASGGNITVREGPGHISLRIQARPPDEIVVDRLDMRVYYWHLKADREYLYFSDGAGFNSLMGLVDHGKIGLHFT